ncbi:MAG: alkaline phosphatase D family protein [Acidobacteria bacterium]|nr:alkaline phosphatase D family protein [Acidobacteriota bacterium]
MNTKMLFCISVLTVVACLSACSRKDPLEEYGEYAPPDAYLEGSKHPYYGSENPWDRRFFTKALNLYGRRGQRQMLDIIEGKPAEAAAYCRQLLANDPTDLESRFNLAVAEAHLGNIDAAMSAVRDAVERGLPFERFIVGPRDVLKPLTESEAFKKYAASRPPVQLLHGPMLGSVTETSARFWVRTKDEVPVQAVVTKLQDPRNPIRSEVRKTEAARDYTAIVEVQGLSAATTYSYDIIIDGKPALSAPLPSFRTFPKADARISFQVAFGGCAGYTPANERMWDLIRSYKPEAFLTLGDNVYIDLPTMPNGLHYYTYYQRQSRPEFRRLVSTTPIYAIWDDHDCAIDDVWMGPYKDKPPWKMPLFNQFRENWANPSYGDPEWPGCWFNFSIGPVEFFMLECRFYRTNPYDKNPTMLGPVQKAWLKEKVRQSQATFKVLASSVEWTFDAKGAARDTWAGFRDERNEIFNFLAENRINGVILLSSDRHRSEAWRIDRPNGYSLYEFESARLTNEHVHELVPGALFGYNALQSFGLLTFDFTGPNPTVNYQIISINNESVHSLTVRLSDLSH